MQGGKIDGSGQAVAAVDAFSATGSHSWSSCLCAPRSCHGSAAICGKLYVVGGQPHLFRRTEWLDHYTDRWLESPLLMCDERKYLGLTAHEGGWACREFPSLERSYDSSRFHLCCHLSF